MHHDGHVIGDAILFYLDNELLSLVGRPSAHNWVQYHAEKDGYDVTIERDERSAVNPTGRKLYRFQVQGPTALGVLEKVDGGPLPEIKFFNLGELTIAGHKVRALASRDVRRARPRAVRAVARRRGRAGRDRRGGQGVRARAGRLAGLCDEHARVGLDPLPVARDFHGR